MDFYLERKKSIRMTIFFWEKASLQYTVLLSGAFFSIRCGRAVNKIAVWETTFPIWSFFRLLEITGRQPSCVGWLQYRGQSNIGWLFPSIEVIGTTNDSWQAMAGGIWIEKEHLLELRKARTPMAKAKLSFIDFFEQPFLFQWANWFRSRRRMS